MSDDHEIRDLIAIGAALYLGNVRHQQMEQLPPLVREEYRKYTREQVVKAALWFVIPMGIAMMTVGSINHIIVGLLGITAFLVPVYTLAQVLLPPVILPQQRLEAAWERHFQSQGTTRAEVKKYLAADAKRQEDEAEAQQQALRDHMDQTIRNWGE